MESLEYLVRDGKQVILVTSGATAVGRQKLRFQQVLNSSPLEMQMVGLSSLQARAAAAAGQSGLMALYDSMFQMMDMQCSQFLVTSRDFKNEDFLKNLNLTVDQLLEMNVVPVINENDCISSVRNASTPPPQSCTPALQMLQCLHPAAHPRPAASMLKASPPPQRYRGRPEPHSHPATLPSPAHHSNAQQKRCMQPPPLWPRYRIACSMPPRAREPYSLAHRFHPHPVHGMLFDRPEVPVAGGGNALVEPAT